MGAFEKFMRADGDAAKARFELAFKRPIHNVRSIFLYVLCGS